MQKKLLVSAAILSFVIGVGTIPIITRVFSSEQLVIVTLLLLSNSLFGILEVLKPVYISFFASKKFKPTYIDLLVPILTAGIFFSLVLFLVLKVFFLEYFNFFDNLIIALSFLVFFAYSTFWAVQDLNGYVGRSALIKAIGVGSIYLLFAIVGHFEIAIFLSAPLLIGHLFTFLVFFYFNKGLVEKNRNFNLDKTFISDSINTLVQNLSKIFIDFTDRLFVSKFFSANLIVIYNMSYDLAARSNMPSGLISAYFYPKICKENQRIASFLSLGINISMCLAILSLLSYAFFDELIILYFGDFIRDKNWIFSIILCSAAMYSLAFFSQGALRASGEYNKLSRIFMIAAVIGVLSLYPLYLWFGIKGVLVSGFILKVPGLMGYFHLDAYLTKINKKKVFLLLLFLIIFIGIVFMREQ